MNAPVHIGTSGWHYPHWKGAFYPPELPPPDWLRYYAQHLSCVEINNSFYRLPEASTFIQWSRQTGEGFLFAVKAWQVITHRRKLGNCATAVDTFLEHTEALQEKCGPLLFQLPPHWHSNAERLNDFLERLPSSHRYAFEFRDPSWHNEKILGILAAHDTAFCIFELGELHSPEFCTTDFVYIRLHGPAGPYAGSYPAHTLRCWAEKLLRWAHEGKEVWLFFDNDQAGYAVKNALLLQSLLDTA